MKVVLIPALLSLLLTTTPAIAGDRGGGNAFEQSQTVRFFESLQKVGITEPVGRAGGGSVRMNDQILTRCVNMHGQNQLIRATYKFNALAGEYRLDRKSLQVIATC